MVVVEVVLEITVNQTKTLFIVEMDLLVVVDGKVVKVLLVEPMVMMVVMVIQMVVDQLMLVVEVVQEVLVRQNLLLHLTMVSLLVVMDHRYLHMLDLYSQQCLVIGKPLQVQLDSMLVVEVVEEIMLLKVLDLLAVAVKVVLEDVLVVLKKHLVVGLLLDLEEEVLVDVVNQVVVKSVVMV